MRAEAGFNPDADERRPNTCTIGWDAERDARLKKLWDDGLSTSDIARQLGGTTKNAVIGRAHRIGCEKRHRPGDGIQTGGIMPSRRSMDQRVKRVKNSKPLKLAKPLHGTPDLVEPIGGRKSILEVGAGECRWPAPGSTFRCCSHQQREGSIYCDYHAGKAYEKPRGPVKPMQARYSVRTGVLLAQ